MDDLSGRPCKEAKTLALAWQDGRCLADATIPGLFDVLLEENDRGVLILEGKNREHGWILRDANPILAELLGLRREDLAGRTLSSLLAPANLPSVERSLMAALRTGRRQTATLEFRSDTERPRPLHACLRPVAGEEVSGGLAVIGVLRPPATEPAELQREAEAAMDRMLAHMSHDLRTPLNGILGFAQLIEHDFAGGADIPRHREYARDIAAAGRELLGRIEDLLVAAEGESDGDGATASEESIDLAPLLESAVAECRAEAERRNVTLTLLRPPELLRISGSGQDCRRILSLLLESALRGAPSGSEVAVGCRLDESRRPAVVCIDRGHSLDLAEILAAMPRQPAESGATDDPAPPPRSTAGLMALRALARRNGAELAFFAPRGGGHATSITFPPHSAD